MPRPKKYDRDTVLDRALDRFWHYGFGATSIDDLVKSTGVNRHGLYAEFGSKHGLFLAVLDHYSDRIVSPAFGSVEKRGAGLEAVRAYFAAQISRGMAMRPSCPGCLVANAAAEIAPHDPKILAAVKKHHKRLECGFEKVLKTQAPGLSEHRISDLARFLRISAQGLWLAARSESDASKLTAQAELIMDMLNSKILMAGHAH